MKKVSALCFLGQVYVFSVKMWILCVPDFVCQVGLVVYKFLNPQNHKLYKMTLNPHILVWFCSNRKLSNDQVLNGRNCNDFISIKYKH